MKCPKKRLKEFVMWLHLHFYFNFGFLAVLKLITWFSFEIPHVFYVRNALKKHCSKIIFNIHWCNRQQGLEGYFWYRLFNYMPVDGRYTHSVIWLIMNHLETIHFTMWYRDVLNLIDIRTFRSNESDESYEKYLSSNF